MPACDPPPPHESLVVGLICLLLFALGWYVFAW
jgi:hypothetical protein